LSEFNSQQLATARAAAWHQNGEALLTLEALRARLNGYGLVLFAPRPQQIAAPAPTFVEAVLGAANAAPTVAEMEPARALLARMVAEGSALPLNLLGSVGDVPDYVVSSKLFSFVFTLRGDKGWKLSPETSGTSRVSQLAVNSYAVLVERGESTAAELVHALGREVTESAVLRALVELWGHLRVLPTPGVEGAETKWELATKRFTKQIKAGINAGVPSALSGLISVYLAQAIAASEDEIEVFLSPLVARSRIREVLHALLAGRQLETVVLDGKTLLHVAGELPEFAAEPVAEVVIGDVSADGTVPESSAPVAAAPASRIRKFAGARPDKERRPFQRERAAGGFAKKSFTKPWEEEKRGPHVSAVSASDEMVVSPPVPKVESAEAVVEQADGMRPAYVKDDEGGWAPTPSVSERAAFDGGERPARKTFGGKPSFGGKPGFGGPRKSFGDRPGGARPGGARPGGARPSRPYSDRAKSFGDKPRFDGARPSYGGSNSDRPRPAFGDKPGFGGPRKSFGDKPGGFGGPRKSFGDRPFRPRTEGGEGRPPRKDFGDRPARPFGDRPKFDGPRKSFGDKPGGFGGPRKSFGDKPSFGGPRKSFGDKPGGFGGPRKSFGDRPFRPRTEGGEGRPPRRDFGDKPAFGGPRKSFGDKPAFGGPRKSFGDRPKFDGPRKSFGDKPAYRPRPSGDGEGRPPRRDFDDKPAYRPRTSEGGEGRPPRKSFGDKPGGFGPKKFGAKPFGAKPGGFGGKPKFGGKPGGGFGGKKFGGKPAGKSGGGKFAGKPAGAKRPRKEGGGGGAA